MAVDPVLSTQRRVMPTQPTPAQARSAIDASDFAVALTAELPRLSRLALRLARDPTLAEDLAQEAASRAWAKRAQLREGSPIAPWLNRILVNIVIDRTRSRRDEITVAEIEDRWRDDDYTVDPEQVLARAEQREDSRMPLPGCRRDIARWWCCTTRPG